GGRHVMLPGSVMVGSLVALTDTRFGMLAQAVKLVAPLSTIVRTAPLPKSPKLHVSTCGVGGPNALTVHPVTAGDSAQFTPLAPVPPSGSVSTSVTLLAVPLPVLVSTMVKVAVSPALMVCPSGVFVTCRFGATQVMLPVSVTVGLLLAPTEARF